MWHKDNCEELAVDCNDEKNCSVESSLVQKIVLGQGKDLVMTGITLLLEGLHGIQKTLVCCEGELDGSVYLYERVCERASLCRDAVWVGTRTCCIRSLWPDWLIHGLVQKVVDTKINVINMTTFLNNPHIEEFKW